MVEELALKALILWGLIVLWSMVVLAFIELPILLALGLSIPVLCITIAIIAYAMEPS